MPKRAVFISHAATDSELANVLFDLLQKGCNLQTTDIYCTSVEGSGIDTGEKFAEHIRENLMQAEIAVLLVTPMYFARPFCVAELGAVWALGKKPFPLVIEGVSRELGANMIGTQTQALNATGLDHLRDAIAKLDPSRPEVATARWNIVRDIALTQMTATVDRLAKPDVVSRAELDKAVAARDEAVQLVAEANTEERRLRQQIADLESLKNRDSVRSVRAKYSTAEEEYEQLRKTARTKLRNLNQPERRVLFGWFKNETMWEPQWNSVDREPIQEAVNRKSLTEYDGRYYELNLRHPAVNEAHVAVAALKTFITSDKAIDVVHRLEAEKGVLPEIDSSEFWEVELLEGRPLWA